MGKKKKDKLVEDNVVKKDRQINMVIESLTDLQFNRLMYIIIEFAEALGTQCGGTIGLLEEEIEVEDNGERQDWNVNYAVHNLTRLQMHGMFDVIDGYIKEKSGKLGSGGFDIIKSEKTDYMGMILNLRTSARSTMQTMYEKAIDDPAYRPYFIVEIGRLYSEKSRDIINLGENHVENDTLHDILDSLTVSYAALVRRFYQHPTESGDADG